MDNRILDLENFKSISKFNEDKNLYYRGISDISLREKLNNLLNNSADQFIEEIKSNRVDNFLKIIEDGVNQFNYLSLDTDDRERVCLYYEQLMDCMAIDSSKGILNTWMYGFDIS